MIESVYIKNFALAKELEINFSKGFNVIVGETGAGKSIIISAILFALGSKVDKSIIRTGENIVRVNLKFVDLSSKVLEMFKEYDVEDELYISRTYNIEGKNECKINGIPLSLTELKNLSANLMDSCMQHETLSVLKTKNQLKFLDAYIGNDINKQIDILSSKDFELKKIQNQLSELGGDPENRERTIDLLKYQINEIEEINPKLNDEEELRESIRKITDTEKIASNLNSVINNFDGSNACISLMKASLHNISAITSYDDNYQNMYSRLQNQIYELEDMLTDVKNETNNLFYDEKEVDRLDKKLDSIKMLKKKYGPTIQDVYEFLNNAKIKLNALENANEQIEVLELKKNQLIKEIYDICLIISNLRRTTATKLENLLMNEFEDLSMKNAKFKIMFNELSNINNFEYNETGMDKIEFMFSANKGEELKSLSKTISGGELSRFMLAFKNIFAVNDSVGTLILDEIDSGISGEIGSKVAMKIANIAKRLQVICISHMQQVAAMADNYVFVEKQTNNDSTESKVKILNEEEQIFYIAKISSGINITDNALCNAKEMKEIANLNKSKL